MIRDRFLREISERTSYGQFRYVDVQFSSAANTDTIIKHDLRPPTPEDVDWQVVRIELATAPGTVPIIYRDGAAARRPWDTGYIVLRSNIASLKATLLLTVRQS